MGIDLNPESIGLSIFENTKIIHAQEFNIGIIFNKLFNFKLASNDDKMKYYQNKLKHEILEISKAIFILAKQYKCKSIFIEDLKFKQKLSKEQKKNHQGNRKNKNLWKRNLLISNLEKRLKINDIK